MKSFEEQFPSLKGAEHFFETDEHREEPVFFAEAIEICCLDKQRVKEYESIVVNA